MKANMPRLTWSIEVVEPAQAKALLDEHGAPPERVRLRRFVDAYVGDMREGRWALNGDAVIFDEDGKLVDGRMRLAACIEADTPFPTFVIRNVPSDSAITIDTHRKRKAADALYVAGYDASADLAAASNMIFHLMRATRINSGQALTADQTHRFVRSTPDLHDAVTSAAAFDSLYGNGSMFAAMIFLTRRIDPAMSDAFFDGLQRGGPDPKGDQPYEALARVITTMRDYGTVGTIQRLMLHQYFAKAWNAFRDGARISRMRYVEADPVRRIKGLVPGMVDAHDQVAVRTGSVRSDYVQAVHDSGVSLEILRVTPAMAERLLEDNGPMLEFAHRNRKRSLATIELYARDMKALNWHLNGQAIKVSEDGRLLDGQHRAAACVKSGVAFETMVVRGLPDEVFSTFDTHARKQFSNTIRTRGFANAPVMQGALRLVWLYENYGLDSTAHPTQSELNDVLDTHGEALRESVSMSMRASIRSMLTSSTFAAAHYLLTRRDPVRSKSFFDKFETGEDLPAGSPILALRNRLVMDRNDRKLSTSEREKLVAVTTAWDAHVEGRAMRTLKRSTVYDPFFRRPHKVGPDAQAPAGQGDAAPVRSAGGGASPAVPPA